MWKIAVTPLPDELRSTNRRHASGRGHSRVCRQIPLPVNGPMANREDACPLNSAPIELGPATSSSLW